MTPILTELEHLEIRLGSTLQQMAERGYPIDPQQLIDFSQLIAAYNKHINLFLKHYATFQACIDNIVQESKIQAKAQLQYAYDFLAAMLDLLRFIELRDRIDEMCYQLVQEFLQRKTELILSNYYPMAKEELENFYNQSLRALMERDLAKRICQRYN